MNIAVSDILVSIMGFFRGLGIMNSKFVGAPNNNTTLSCVVYTIFLNTFASSGAIALLPLTIDRLVAITLPLSHKSIITKRNCAIMFGATWSPLLILFLYNSVAYAQGTIPITYYNKYHRCIISSRHSYIEEVCFLLVPFLLILVLYLVMLFFIIKNKMQCGRFLTTATGIIMTSLLSYSPTVIASTGAVPMSYEVSQLLTVTAYYINGIVNPLIYFVAHPITRNYVRKLRSDSVKQSMVYSAIRLNNRRGVDSPEPCALERP